MNKLLILLVVLLLFVASCGGSSNSNSHKYPNQVKDTFMKSCGADSSSGSTANRICQCSFEAIEKEYTLKEYTDLQNSISKGGSPDEFISIVTKCAQQN